MAVSYGSSTSSNTKAQPISTSSVAQKPVLEKQSVVQKGTSNRIFGISESRSASATNEFMPSRIEVMNDGNCPINILSGYETYSDETTGAGATRYLHTVLMPGESFSPPVKSVISTEAASTQFDGTSVGTLDPVSVDKTAGGSPTRTNTFLFDEIAHITTLGADIEENSTTVTTAANGTNAFRVGDLIQIGTTSDTTVSKLEIMRVVSIDSTTVMTVERGGTSASDTGLYGSNIVDKDNQTDPNRGAVSGAKIFLPYFNAYHDYNKFATAQTDAQGKFKAFNMFNLGRSTSAAANAGIVPGSFGLRFYEAGYQEFGLNGITINSNTGLTAGETYFFNISIDGATADEISFAVDSANTNFGGKNGVVSKIQAAIDALFYDKSKNNFEKAATVAIVNGDLRVTSDQSTTSSAIALTVASSGGTDATRLFSGDNAMGRLSADPKKAVLAKVPDENTFDNVTYTSSPNTTNLVYDDGMGNLMGAATGSINYETGAFDLVGGIPNASFKFIVNHSSAFSGKLNEGTAGRINSVKEILVNTFSQKNGSVVLKTF
tara:strand:- start:855 stop:2498 length:1644 start_codon:yes stop_codon:yes gene_type:complete